MPFTIVSSTSVGVDKFLEKFKENPLHARVMATDTSICTTEHVIFEQSPTKYQFVEQTLTYGVSTTMKMYRSKKRGDRMLIDGKKFYFVDHDNRMTQLMPGMGPEWMQHELLKRHPWVRFLIEYQFHISLNSVCKYKLFKPSRVLRHIYGFDGPKAEIFHKRFLEMEMHTKKRPYLLRCIENLPRASEEFLSYDPILLRDCIHMAGRLARKVNAQWGQKRITEEHDKMSDEIDAILGKEPDRELMISPIFVKLNDTVGGMITRSKQLIREGRRMRHCVGSYGSRVDAGTCAIYHYKGHTAQVGVDGNGSLILLQFRGLHNAPPPEEIDKELRALLKDFNDRTPENAYAPVIPILEYDVQEMAVDRAYAMVPGDQF